MTTEIILGYSITTKSADDCAEFVLDWSRRSEGIGWLACFNPHSYAIGRHDVAFKSALSSANLLVPDGAGVVLASKLLGGQICARVTGSDIFSSLCAKMNDRSGMKVFFLGSSKANLRKIEAKMRSDFPNVTVVGTYSPPFKSEFSERDMEDMVRAVNRVSPDILWVGLTAPKQEKWLAAASGRLDVKFAVAIGAVFDFYSGNVRRPHPLFQKLGLEWLPRLIRNPRRLWQRTFISAPIFVWNVVKASLGMREHKGKS